MMDNIKSKIANIHSAHVKYKILSVFWWIIRFIIIFGVGFIILKPIIGKVLLSFMHPEDLLDNTVKLYPKTPSTYYWRFALNNLHLPKSFVNTLVLSLTIGIIQVVSSTMIGYGLARFKFRGRGIAFFFVIVIMLVPYQVISISQYLGFVYFGVGTFTLNLSDSFIPLYILAFTGLGVKEGLYIYLLRENFRSLPGDLEDASYIDGAGVMRTFLSIMVPNARTMMVTVFLFSFCWQWTDTTYSSLYLLDVKVLSNVVQELYVRHGVFYDTMGTIITRSAASIFIMIPLLGLFGVCQRMFVKSIAQAGMSNV